MNSVWMFFIKRILIVYGVLVVACFFGRDQRLSMIIALTVSILFSCFRMISIERIFRVLTTRDNKRKGIVINILLYLLHISIVGVSIVVALNVGLKTFLAAMAGNFLIVLIIMANAVTEALGITRNKFGQKVQ